MPVTLRDARDSPADREWIRAVYRSYLSELSAGKSGLFPALGEWNEREGEFLVGLFGDATSYPFILLHGETRSGFALITRVPSFPQRGVDYRMAEFFVTAPARRRGVGAAAAELLFSRFSGEWEVVEDAYNRPALSFWRRVISRQTEGHYTETREAGEVCHRFRTTARPSASPA